MDKVEKSLSAAPRSLPEAVTRMLRHEVGDLLQTVYATVAILQRRLPNDAALERRVLTDMRARAEACKQLLDLVHDFVCPISLATETVDLAELSDKVRDSACSRTGEIEIRREIHATPKVTADARRLVQVGELLLANACEAAHRYVSIQTSQDETTHTAEWTVTDDGPGVPADHLDRLFTPFFTTRHGHPGLGLALAQKLVILHGGTISAENVAGGGFRVRVVLPLDEKPLTNA